MYREVTDSLGLIRLYVLGEFMLILEVHFILIIRLIALRQIVPRIFEKLTRPTILIMVDKIEASMAADRWC